MSSHLLRCDDGFVLWAIHRVMIEVIRNADYPLIKDDFRPEAFLAYLNVTSQLDYRPDISLAPDEQLLSEAKLDVLGRLTQRQRELLFQWLEWAETNWKGIQENVWAKKELKGALSYWRDRFERS